MAWADFGKGSTRWVGYSQQLLCCKLIIVVRARGEKYNGHPVSRCYAGSSLAMHWDERDSWHFMAETIRNTLYLAESPPSRVNVALVPKLCNSPQALHTLFTDDHRCRSLQFPNTFFFAYVIAVISMTLDVCGNFWRSYDPSRHAGGMFMPWEAIAWTAWSVPQFSQPEPTAWADFHWGHGTACGFQHWVGHTALLRLRDHRGP